jgi:hypothetical protein
MSLHPAIEDLEIGVSITLPAKGWDRFHTFSDYRNSYSGPKLTLAEGGLASQPARQNQNVHRDQADKLGNLRTNVRSFSKDAAKLGCPP